ncbi:hypothetical protein M9458_055837 [Cirrhinus mrigala]|uniref:Uncharacterized protein n=1 Tax=Cirrhinus mrigala TaxID=683832 RepID=A0ABD0MIA2_CIRMR
MPWSVRTKLHMFDKSAGLNTSTCQYSVTGIAPPAGSWNHRSAVSPVLSCSHLDLTRFTRLTRFTGVPLQNTSPPKDPAAYNTHNQQSTMDPASRLIKLRQGPAHAMPDAPESAPVHKMAAIPEPVHKMAAIPEQLTAVLHESSQVTTVVPESSHVTAVVHESSQVTAVVPESSQATADLHEPSRVTAGLHEPGQDTVVLHESSQVTADLPESSQVTADLPKSHHVSADPLEPRCVSGDLLEPRHVSADPPEPRHVSADIPKPCQVLSQLPSHMSTASTPSRSAGIPLSTVLPVLAVAILSVWATHCAPEASSDHESAPEASPDHESAPEASSVHRSVPEAFPAHEFVPIPPEVSACTVEPPKEVASIN